eukprot:6699532-Alexandrium_andersonii.AAC.1
MSASLVGSEMCIRDSQAAEDEVRLGEAQLEHAWTSGAGRGGVNKRESAQRAGAPGALLRGFDCCVDSLSSTPPWPPSRGKYLPYDHPKMAAFRSKFQDVCEMEKVDRRLILNFDQLWKMRHRGSKSTEWKDRCVVGLRCASLDLAPLANSARGRGGASPRADFKNSVGG